MNTIFYGKSIVASAMAAIAVILSVLTGCHSDLMDDSCCAKFTAFEKEFAKTLSSEKDVVKLIGFRTHTISDDERPIIKQLVKAHGEELAKTNKVFSDDLSYCRSYFPLHTAIVEYDGKTYTADEKGVVSIPYLKDISKIKVIGRKRSETVRGTGSNIIEEDRILLKEAFKQEVRNGVKTGYSIEKNACVFDFKVLTSMNESSCSKIASTIPRLKSGAEYNVSCVDNHGGQNCSDAFGIYHGRCPFDANRCMDYNGIFPNCDNPTGMVSSFIAWLGSDCDLAMSWGHCWNEYM